MKLLLVQYTSVSLVLFVLLFFGNCACASGYDEGPIDRFTSSVLVFSRKVVDHLRNDDGITGQRCRTDLDDVIREAGLGHEWAMRLFDSIGKPSSGVMNGGVNFPGYFSECVEDRSIDGNVKGKYCLIRVKFLRHVSDDDESKIGSEQNQSKARSIIPSDFSVGFCVPSSCNQQDIDRAARSAALSLGSGGTVEAETDECYVDVEQFQPDVLSGFLIWIFIASLLLALVGTVLDAMRCRQERLNIVPADAKSCSEAKHQQHDESGSCLREQQKGSSDEVENDAVRFSSNASTDSSSSTALFKKQATTDSFLVSLFCAFSLVGNARKILAPPSAEGAHLGALHGIRFLSMAWIIVGHTFYFAQKWLFFRNPEEMTAATKHVLSQAFANGTFSVDTFFFLSGFLVAYTLLKRLKQSEGRFNIFHFYVHRYLRMTPVMMIVIAFSATFLKYFGSGPSWRQATLMYDSWCKQNWWVNALYIQNFHHSQHMCLSHTWYSAVDMQFYLVAPVILCMLYKYSHRGLTALLIPFLVTSICPAVYTIIYHLPAVPSDTVPIDLMNEYYSSIYIKPYCRMGPYLVGISLAYFLHRKNSSFRLSKICQILGWVSAILLNVGVICSMTKVFKSEPPTDAESAAYNGLARTAWAMTVAWITLVCVANYPDILSRILSARVLVPLSRLTYSAYLVHPVLMAMFYGTRETVFDFSLYWLVYQFIGNLVITYAVSFVLSLLFELPVVNLEKLLLFRKSKPSQHHHLRYITEEPNTRPESLLKN